MKRNVNGNDCCEIGHWLSDSCSFQEKGVRWPSGLRVPFWTRKNHEWTFNSSEAVIAEAVLLHR